MGNAVPVRFYPSRQHGWVDVEGCNYLPNPYSLANPLNQGLSPVQGDRFEQEHRPEI